MPTLAQVLGVTGEDWSLRVLQDAFTWLRPERGLPAMQTEITESEARCLWLYHLCHKIARLPPNLAAGAFHYMLSTVQRWNTAESQSGLVVLVDDCWIFCTGLDTAWNVRTTQASDGIKLVDAISPAIKSTAYNLGRLTQQLLAECLRLDPQTGKPDKDDSDASPRPASSAETSLDQS